MYKATVDGDFEYTNFTVEQQDKILAARRSNNELDANKLVTETTKIGCAIPEIHEGVQMCLDRMKAGLIAQHGEDYHPHLPKKLSQS